MKEAEEILDLVSYFCQGGRLRHSAPTWGVKYVDRAQDAALVGTLQGQVSHQFEIV